MKKNVLKPDYLFEVSWEVCNKNSGIHSLIGSKAAVLTKALKDNYICIGPDVWMEIHSNPEFIEDKFLYRSWREQAESDGIHIRIGRWNVPGEPVVMLVDFTPLFGEKDNIFSEYWTKYGLNSLNSQWEFTEPAMFGYAAGQLIEHFYEYHLTAIDKIIAQFHDWHPGTGILYLNDKVPQAGTVLTLHHTVIGKELIRRNITIDQDSIKEIDPDIKAQEFGIICEHSLEKSAAKYADVLTTLNADLVGQCKHYSGREPGFLTPGLDVDDRKTNEDKDQSAEKEVDSSDDQKGITDWETLIEYYYGAYDQALHHVNERHDKYKDKKPPARLIEIPALESDQPTWKKISVKIGIPDDFRELPELTKNLWWTWNHEASGLFRVMDPDLWEKCDKNPSIMVEQLTTGHYERLAKDETFMQLYRGIAEKFQQYMDVGKNKPSGQIAYFSMEYGLHESIKTYSGGLGVLAGDFLKQASDDNLNMTGIGLLYRYGYFHQSISATGEQQATYIHHKFPDMSAKSVRDEHGEWKMITIAFPGRNLHARIWKIDVGRIPLYLLDTDIPENTPADRFITHKLYGGDWENRFKQEFLLGIGGIRLLDALGIKPDIYHCNEGHAAFTGLERLRKYVQDERLTFHEALEVVRASSLFTTHTPVPAGHDEFSEDMLRTYMPHYPERLGIAWETFMGLGRRNPKDNNEKYSMSILAIKMAHQVNGVSRIHGGVSRDMFKDLFPGYFKDEIHIGHVTNGVHYGTWTAERWQQLYNETFGGDFQQDVSDAGHWEKIRNVPDERIWEIRNDSRSDLFNYIKKRLLSNLSRRQETPRKIYQILEATDKKALTLGFARRFATYKRAKLLFNDLDRLSKIVNNPKMPVQIIYAGKAHPADKSGQDFIRNIVEISKRKEFLGKVIFLEDYDMELGAALTTGVDVWLNTPTRPQEASGTSGQKAALNGVLNLSVLDGWWAEGYIPEGGWMLKEEATYDDQTSQDELDAETIYSIIETEMAPMFYERNNAGVPEEWVKWIKNCIAGIAPHYTNKRMMDDYMSQYYQKLFSSSEKIHANEFSLARELARWKGRVIRGWNGVELTDLQILTNAGKTIKPGELFKAKVSLKLNELKVSDVGVEVVFAQKKTDGKRELSSVYEMDLDKHDKGIATFTCELPADRTGEFNYAFRMFPGNEVLPHRQDFNLVRWL